VWIRDTAREQAQSCGYTVVDLATVVTTHLSEVIRRHANEFLGRQEVQQLLDNLKASHPKVVEELVPNLLTLGQVGKVLQNLVREQIPVRDLLTVLETLADWAPLTKDVDTLSEYVRQAQARTISGMYQTGEGRVPVITLDPTVEQQVADAIQRTDHGNYLALEPARAQGIMEAIGRHLEVFARFNYQPIVLCAAHIRLHLRRLAERFMPTLVVLSYNDIAADVTVQSLATVGLSDEN
jgi:flagellar biosynthesis protein FlhA